MAKKPRSADTTRPKRRRAAAAAAPRRTPARADADHNVRNAAFAGAAVLGAVAAGVAAAFRFGWLDRLLPAGEGHDADDLMGDTHPGPDHRAPEAFRPDMDAPMTAAEREALRPATGHAPGFAADRGTTVAPPDPAA